MKTKKFARLPNTFANNLSQLFAQEKMRDEKSPLHLRLMNKSIKVFGSSTFLWLNVAGFVLWISVNVGLLSSKPFDPYPFEFLTLAVSLEAIVLSVIVLIAQNKLQTDSDERAYLDLHINLLAESETTLILRKLERIEKHLQITVEKEEIERVADLIEETHPEKLAEYIHQTFSDKV